MRDMKYFQRMWLERMNDDSVRLNYDMLELAETCTPFIVTPYDPTYEAALLVQRLVWKLGGQEHPLSYPLESILEILDAQMWFHLQKVELKGDDDDSNVSEG